jgi:hypothetical protein
VKVGRQCLVGQQFLKCVEARSERYLVIDSVDAFVAFTANADAHIELVFRKPFTEAFSSMNLFRDQVMEGERHHPTTTSAGR